MKGKILAYLSSADRVPLKEGGTHATGVFLGELTEPLKLFLYDYEIDFVTPNGGKTVIDKNSYKLMYWGFSKKKLEEGESVLAKMKKAGMENPKSLKVLLEEPGGLDEYDMLFIPGGHSPMTDILYEDWLKSEALNKNTGRLLGHFHERNKPTALICHAPSVLAAAGDIDGVWVYTGYRMTCITRVNEWLTEDAPFFKVIDGHLKNYPEKILRDKGAMLQQKNIPMLSNVIEDRELITGQDPYSAKLLGERMKLKLDGYLSKKVKGKVQG
jgi:putative intracellular protease/amidase